MSEAQQDPTEKREGLLSIYGEICTNIRTTDETSFNLLRLVPFVSFLGTGALAFLPKASDLNDYAAWAIIAVSLFGAVVTYALFRWEMRNIQKCNWLISRAARIEKKLFGKGVQFGGIAGKPDFKARTLGDIQLASRGLNDWGKTESSRAIYLVSMVAWLIPVGMVLPRAIGCPLQ